MTGSGKTYTMMGPAPVVAAAAAEEEGGEGGESLAGIIPRAIAELFERIEQGTCVETQSFTLCIHSHAHRPSFNSPGTEAALVRLSFVELYNNAFRNLLQENGHGTASSWQQQQQQQPHPPGPKRQQPSSSIEIRESADGTTFLEGPPGLRVPVTSAAAALALVRRGHKARATGATRCNTHSSRSHAILTFWVETRGAGGGWRRRGAGGQAQPRGPGGQRAVRACVRAYIRACLAFVHACSTASCDVMTT